MTKSNLKIAIHAGHATKGARGASGLLDESKENRLIKTHLIRYLKDAGCKVIDCSCNSGNQSEVLRGIRSAFYKKGGDSSYINVSLHLNAGGGHGYETWVSLHNPHTGAINRFNDALARSLGMTNRGVKKTSSLYVTNQLPNCILLELGFVDSHTDYSIYKKLGEKEIARKIAHYLIKFGEGMK